MTRPSAYSERWKRHDDLIRTQLQETGQVRVAFLTLADLFAACDDLGIDPRSVEFVGGYARVKA